MRDRVRDDEGALLVMALAFLAFFGVVVGALLGLVDSGLRATTQIRAQGAELYAADGALTAALVQARSLLLADDPDVPAFALSGDDDTCPAYTVPDLNGQSVTVECEVAADSRELVPGGGGVNENNTPAYAVLVLGEGLSDRLEVRNNDTDKDTDGAVFKVRGDLASNAPLSVPNRPFEVDGKVTAPSCDPSDPTDTNFVVTGTRDCVSTTVFDDPDYDAAVSTQPADGLLPTTCVNGAIVLIPAGTYTNAKALSDLINGCNATFLFTGTYYFDFDPVFEPVNPSCGGIPGTQQWCIENANATIIGGTPQPTSIVEPCLSPGVQWIFGGESRLNVQAIGSMTLCPEPHEHDQRIAIYAKSPPDGSDTPVSASVTLEPATATSSKSGKDADFANAAAALVFEDPAQVATSSLDKKNQTVTLRLDGFPTDAIPIGATIDEVRIRISHGEGPVDQLAATSVTLHPGDGSTAVRIPASADAACTFCISPVLHDDLFAVSGLDEAEKINGLAVTYSVTSANPKGPGTIAATAELDGIVVEVDYTIIQAPFGEQSGCVLDGSCDLITTDGNNTGVRILGTIYAPESSLSLKTVNDGVEVAQRGVIARSLVLTMPTVSYDPGVSIQIPSTIAGPDGITPAHVTLRAFLADEPTAPRATVDVRLDDEAVTGPIVDVRRWTVTR